MTDKYDKLEKLKNLRDQGTLTEEEFLNEKSKLLAGGEQGVWGNDGSRKHWGMDEKTFCMLLHLSQLANIVVPIAGIVLPIVMWATEKDKSPKIDAHGKIVLNWLISVVIYGICSAILAFLGIGFLMLIALAVVNLVFVILAAIKANEGQIWRYPLAIPFFPV